MAEGPGPWPERANPMYATLEVYKWEFQGISPTNIKLAHSTCQDRKHSRDLAYSPAMQTASRRRRNPGILAGAAINP